MHGFYDALLTLIKIINLLVVIDPRLWNEWLH